MLASLSTVSSGPRVSVVIASHNGAAYLPRALSSVFAQSEPDIEVVLVDDASTDGTLQLFLGLSKTEQRLRYVRLPENLGPSTARNLGIQSSTGDWIAILDVDDWFAEDRLRDLLRTAEAADADIVSDGIEIFDERTGRPSGPMFGPGDVPRTLSALAFVDGNLPNPARPRSGFGFLKPMIRRRFLLDTGISYAPDMRFAEDYRLYLDLLLAGARWVTVQENSYVYAVRDGSATARHGAGDLDRLRRYERDVIESGRPMGRELRAALSRHCRTLDERYHEAAFSELVAGRQIRAALATMTRDTIAFRSCARRAVRAVARRVLPQPIRVEAT